MGRLASDRQESPLSAGQLAARSGVAVSTIHFYEAEGLIRGWRSTGNQRRYGRDVLRRVAVIKVAQRLGLPLARIRDAMNSLPGGRTPTAADWKRLSAQWRSDLQHRIRILQKLSRELDGCIGCGCLSLKICRLRNSSDRLSRQGPGPRLLDPPDGPTDPTAGESRVTRIADGGPKRTDAGSTRHENTSVLIAI